MGGPTPPAALPQFLFFIHATAAHSNTAAAAGQASLHLVNNCVAYIYQEPAGQYGRMNSCR